MNSYNPNNQYANISKFGNGSMGHLFGPRTLRCQVYMSDRCAENWDGFCEYFYQKHGSSSEWPNNQKWPDIRNRTWETQAGLSIPLTTGEHLLKNTAEKKFCTIHGCSTKSMLFDPTNPNSPMITYYVNDTEHSTCLPVCRVNPDIIDNDIVMDRMLLNPEATAGTLINICNTAKNEGTDLSGTKIGAFCDRYFKYL